ncbi:hypothetical protein FOA52_000389 [Chlamydomonas sp. UWO 241]|nr:hypothetical protein FOA52_000389 [Chlamydomonas sp. UWO 241]
MLAAAPRAGKSWGEIWEETTQVVGDVVNKVKDSVGSVLAKKEEPSQQERIEQARQQQQQRQPQQQRQQQRQPQQRQPPAGGAGLMHGPGGLLGGLVGRAVGGMLESAISKIGAELEKAAAESASTYDTAAARVEGSERLRNRMGGQVTAGPVMSQSMSSTSINGVSTKVVNIVFPVSSSGGLQGMARAASREQGGKGGMADVDVTRAQAVNASGVAAALVDAFKAAGTAAPPSVDAAQGPTSSGFSPIGTGDNLLEFRKRVTALKNYYQDARKYLGTDDAVRIGGYISKLEALEIDFISAYPIGEVEYFTVQINLVDRILSQTYQLIRDAGGWVKYAATIIQLRIEIERTRRNLISSGGSSVRQADATTAPGTLDGLAGAEALASVNGGVDAALAALVGNEDLIARVVQEAEAVNEVT